MAHLKGWTMKIKPSKGAETFLAPSMALSASEGHFGAKKVEAPFGKASYGFPRLKIIISNNIYTIGTLVILCAALEVFLDGL